MTLALLLLASTLSAPPPSAPPPSAPPRSVASSSLGATPSAVAARPEALPGWVPVSVETALGFEAIELVSASPLPSPSAQAPQLTPEQRERRQERLKARKQEEREAEKVVDPNRSTFEFPLPAARGGGTVTGSAAAIDGQQDQAVVLSGGVDLAYQDVRIEAERIELDVAGQSLVARGGVILDQGPRRLTGDSATFDLATKTGTLTNATAFLEPDYFFSGAELSKVGEDSYTVVDGIFTSCDEEVPDWSFKVRSARVNVGGYAQLRGASFRVKKVPLLYAPYILWPAKLDRASGFLVAQPGYSSRRGASISAAYYQTLGRSADTTIFTDLYSQGFIGVGDELRYALSEGTEGIFEGYAIRDPDDDQWRWKLNLEHTTEDLPLGLRGVVSFSDYSDFRYFEEFERDFDRATLRQIRSRGFLSGNWGTHSLNVQVDSLETLIAFDNPATPDLDEGRGVTLRSLPEVEYRLRSTQLGELPLYLEADASLALLDVQRSGSYDGSYGRVDLFPSVELPIKTWPWLSLSLTGGYRLTWWGDSLCNLATDANGDPLGSGQPCEGGVQAFTGESFDRATPVITADVFGPSFSRVFEKEIGDFGKFKHIIGPRLTYGFVNVDDQDATRAPLYDERDSLASGNSVRVALINKVLGKPSLSPADEEPAAEAVAGAAAGLAEDAAKKPAGEVAETAGDGESEDGTQTEKAALADEALAAIDSANEADQADEEGLEIGEKPGEKAAGTPAKKINASSREIFSFELAQSFSFDSDQPLQRSGELEEQWSPISALATFNPTDGTSLRAEVFYSTLFSRVTSTSLSGSYLLPRSNTVGLTYVNRVNAQDGATQSDQVRLWTGLNLIPKRLKLDAQLNYDLEDSSLQQQRYVLRYTGACYGVQVEFRDARFGLDRNQDYRVAITLKNVGTFLDLSGRTAGSSGF